VSAARDAAVGIGMHSLAGDASALVRSLEAATRTSGEDA
jgi:hypothetical protein